MRSPRRLLGDAAGATAVEFAMIVPLVILLLMGGIVLGVAIWVENILQATAQVAARCIALQLAPCRTVPAGCPSASAATCYVLAEARKRGLPDLTAQQIAIDTSRTISAASFTTVTISYPIVLSTYTTLLSGTYTLTGSGSFPN